MNDTNNIAVIFPVDNTVLFPLYWLSNYNNNSGIYNGNTTEYNCKNNRNQE